MYTQTTDEAKEKQADERPSWHTHAKQAIDREGGWTTTAGRKRLSPSGCLSRATVSSAASSGIMGLLAILVFPSLFLQNTRSGLTTSQKKKRNTHSL